MSQKNLTNFLPVVLLVIAALQNLLGNSAANQLPQQIKNLALPLFFLITIVFIVASNWQQTATSIKRTPKALHKPKSVTEAAPLQPEYFHMLSVTIMSGLVPYVCVSYFLGYISSGAGGAGYLFLPCIFPISLGLLVASIMSRNTRNIVLSLVAVVITITGFFNGLWTSN